jgi:hypothetical protein
MRRHAITPFAKAVAKLDRALSILVRSEPGGCVTCVAIDTLFDCGHFKRRECMATRFDYHNVAKQCRKCNHFNSGMPYEFSLAIDRTWGKGTSARLHKLSHTIKQWDVRELDQLASAAKLGMPVYRQLYDELTSR